MHGRQYRLRGCSVEVSLHVQWGTTVGCRKMSWRHAKMVLRGFGLLQNGYMKEPSIDSEFFIESQFMGHDIKCSVVPTRYYHGEKGPPVG
jgi:hypothetical protein